MFFTNKKTRNILLLLKYPIVNTYIYPTSLKAFKHFRKIKLKNKPFSASIVFYVVLR